MEDSKLNPEENNSIESSPNLNEDNKDLNEGNKKEENVKAFTEFLEKASNQDSSEEKVKLDSEQQKLKIDKSLFKRFFNNGFDGISTNPNYKMLAFLQHRHLQQGDFPDADIDARVSRHKRECG